MLARRARRTVAAFTTLAISLLAAVVCFAGPLPGTQPLTEQGDLAAGMVAGIDRFLMQQTQEAARHRPAVPDRTRLAKILGVVDPRTPFTAPELIARVTGGWLRVEPLLDYLTKKFGEIYTL